MYLRHINKDLTTEAVGVDPANDWGNAGEFTERKRSLPTNFYLPSGVWSEFLSFCHLERYLGMGLLTRALYQCPIISNPQKCFTVQLTQEGEM